MTIEEILALESADAIVAELRNGRNADTPDVDKAEKALDQRKHDVNDTYKRPDKVVKVDEGTDREAVRIVKVARIAVAIQKLIINRTVAFCFGNPVAYNATPDGEMQEEALKSIKRVLHSCKTNTLNRKVARSVFGYKECAEMWYVTEGAPHSKYGFKTNFKIRVALLSPKDGNVLYPYFDELGDMIAFSRSYVRVMGGGERIEYFETYTDEYHFLWVKGKDGYKPVDGYPKPNAIGKIPVVYGRQDAFETEDVDNLIDRLEKLLSNFADTNDYHASPKIFTTGEIVGFAQKGEAGAIVQGETGATAQYLSWQHAPESVKLEIETLLKLIYTISQTPDISFESVKGLGAISGIALKLLFMDAHLKVQDKMEIFGDYLQRRVNIIKAFGAKLNPVMASALEEIEVEPEITPYMPTSEIDDINMWLSANGNKPLVSQKASVKGANLTQDPEKDFEQIQEEANAENSFSIGEPVMDA